MKLLLPKLLTILLLLNACSSDFPEEMKKVEKLLHSNDSLRKTMLSIPLNQMDSILGVTKEGLILLSEHQPSNDEKEDYLLYMNWYSDVNKTFNRSLPRYQSIQKALSESHAQLEALHHDLKHNLIADTLVQRYITEEEMILSQLKNQIQTCQERFEMKQSLFFEINQKVESYLQSIRPPNEKE